MSNSAPVGPTVSVGDLFRNRVSKRELHNMRWLLRLISTSHPSAYEEFTLSFLSTERVGPPVVTCAVSTRTMLTLPFDLGYHLDSLQMLCLLLC